MSFRRYLQAELARRCAQNQRYSLRAFARTLGVDHSTLSQILRGKRNLTPTVIERFGRKLGLDAETRARFAVEPHRRPAVREDVVRLLADWEHGAIVELAQLDCFQPDSRWIARVLGITADAVNIALNA